MLEDGGHLAVLSTPWVVPDDADPFWWDVQNDYEAVGVRPVDPATEHPDRIGDDFVRMFDGSDFFEPPATRRHRFDVTFTTDQYVANLNTQSGVKMLDEDARSELVSRVSRRIGRRGGAITGHFLAVLTVARRAIRD